MDVSSNGYLELCMGPMFSGKTTQLIQAYKQYTYIQKKICVINFHLDTRYHETMLSTHDKTMIPCIQASLLRDVMNEAKNADVILINEGQFFSDLFSVVIELVETYNKTVHIFALDGDFERKRFGAILDLIPYSDTVTKLNSLCAICKNGRKAMFSHRVSQESAQIVIGSDNYQPLCRTCYLHVSSNENSASVCMSNVASI